MSNHLEGQELEDAMEELDKLYIRLAKLVKSKKIMMLISRIVGYELDIEKECNR